MNTLLKATLESAQSALNPWVQEANTPEPTRLDVRLQATDLRSAAEALRSAAWGTLSAITGLDQGEQIEVLYHFSAGRLVLTLRVTVPKSDPRLLSLSGLFPSAELAERELREMFGVEIEGLTNTDHVFLPDDWRAGDYPLRKDFSYSPQPLSQAPAEPPGQTFIIPIGPQHPALKEPEHFRFMVEGEIVKSGTVRLGYAHRGIEKAAEARTWTQTLYLMERVCGICSHAHALGYSLAVEHLAGVEAPPRAQAIRTLIAEVERLHSHLLWLGVAAHEAGFDTLFMYSWRDREQVMDTLEAITGNRVNYSANVLGGVKVDIDPSRAEALQRMLTAVEARTHHYLEVVNTDASFLRRTRGIGVMSMDQALEAGVVGPTARASGLSWDVRLNAPYAAYERYPLTVITETNGDLEARFVVRVRELLASCTLIRAILDDLPTGDLTARMPRRIPAGEAISRIEAPRGELFYFVRSVGSDSPDRVKVRTPTMCNLTSAVALAVGHQLADVPMILAGVDPCFSCNDR